MFLYREYKEAIETAELMFTNRREFGHFLKSGEGISTNILTNRLDKLQCFGIIKKNPHPAHGKKFIYDLTDQGLKLTPTVIEFTLWSVDIGTRME